jgi:branched-chain amino acid transport system ATP-binding protein
MAEPAPALELAAVTAGYGDTVILEGTDLALGPGERLSVLGRNGVGKTTLIDTIMGHTRLRHGRLRLAGREIARWPPWRRARAGLGYVPQEREIFPSLTVREHLQVAARPGPWTLERAHQTFPSLAERRHHRGDALSGGEQQMLAIARALVGNPKVLLMDEPTEGLAPIIVGQIHAKLDELRRAGLTMLLVEQNVGFATSLADRVCIIGRGALVWQGTSAAIRADHAVQARWLGL